MSPPGTKALTCQWVETVADDDELDTGSLCQVSTTPRAPLVVQPVDHGASTLLALQVVQLQVRGRR